jgi:hypothetical protein
MSYDAARGKIYRRRACPASCGASEAKFKKSERAIDGAKAISEYKEGDAERAKTERLRAQRLAKEAAKRRNEQRCPVISAW